MNISMLHNTQSQHCWSPTTINHHPQQYSLIRVAYRVHLHKNVSICRLVRRTAHHRLGATPVLASSRGGRTATPADPSPPGDGINTVLHGIQLFSIAAAATCQIIHMKNTAHQQNTMLQHTKAPQQHRTRGASPATPPSTSPTTTTPTTWVVWWLVLAAAAGALLSQRLRATLSRTFGGVATGAQAAAKLVQLDTLVQQQRNDIAKALQSSAKLQTRVRISSRDFKLPVKQLQQRSAEHADAINKLAEAQTRLGEQVMSLQQLLEALQGVSAKQVAVMAASFQKLQATQSTLQTQIDEMQEMLCESINTTASMLEDMSESHNKNNKHDDNDEDDDDDHNDALHNHALHNTSTTPQNSSSPDNHISVMPSPSSPSSSYTQPSPTPPIASYPSMLAVFDHALDTNTPGALNTNTPLHHQAPRGKSGTASCRCTAMLDIADCDGDLGVAATQLFDAGYTSMLQHMMDVDVALRNGTVVMAGMGRSIVADGHATTASFHTDGTVTYHFVV